MGDGQQDYIMEETILHEAKKLTPREAVEALKRKREEWERTQWDADFICDVIEILSRVDGCTREPLTAEEAIDKCGAGQK